MKIYIKNKLSTFKNLFLILFILMGVLDGSAMNALAEHEADHRFTISGYVYDDQGKPLSNTAVVVRDISSTVIGTTKTSSNGSYRVKLHLHDEALGIKLLVIANEKEKEIVVDFDPYDASTERVTEVNFGAFQETEESSNKGVIIGAVSFAVLLIGAYVIFSGKKKQQKKMTKGKKGKKGKNKKKR